MVNLNQSLKRMVDQISIILNRNVHSIWLYGSVVLDDFQLGWSDIDLLVLSNKPITEQQAEQLVGLRQIMLEAEPDNLYYRSFEGIIADKNEYFSGSFSRLVYWGTSGQRITDCYQQDVFSAYELAKYGKSIYGENDRSIFVEPSAAELRSAVKQHYESIRLYAVQTDEKLYSCGWLLDIARCIYTLRYNDVIAKTQAGHWALSEHVFQDEIPLKKALEIRQNPAAYKDKEDVKQWLRGLGSVVQQYADVLEQEMNHSLLIRRMTESDLEPLYSLLSDPEVMRFLEPPYTREKVSAFHQIGLSEDPLVYAVEENGAFAGYVIYHPYEEDSIEIGWVLLPKYWKHGYASELTRQMIDWASGENKTLVIECDPQQEVTKHIAQKFGFTRAGSRDGLDVYERNIVIKKMETDDEIKGKAYVHWQSWHEAYPGIVSQDYLDRFTLEKAEKMAFSWGGDHLIIAKAGERVIGFVGYGDRGEEAPDTGEIFALYVLSEYYGTGVGKQLMDAGLEQLKGYPKICLWVLKENKRAIRFYEKCGFHPDGQEMFSKNVEATEIRMILHKQA